MSARWIALTVAAVLVAANMVAAAPIEPPNLLSSLLRQTLYARMKNLLLDQPTDSSASSTSSSGSATSSAEQHLIVEAAVENYRRQRQPQELSSMPPANNGGEALPLTKLAGENSYRRKKLIQYFLKFFLKEKRNIYKKQKVIKPLFFVFLAVKIVKYFTKRYVRYVKDLKKK
jgi:hypothetical protein